MAFALVLAGLLSLGANFAASHHAERAAEPTTTAQVVEAGAATAFRKFVWVAGAGLIVAGVLVAVIG